MKNFFVVLFLMSSVFSQFFVVHAQERTIEKRTTTDSTGNTVTTEAVIISQTEDITPRNNMLIINPLKFFLFYNFSYYRKVSPSFVVGGGFQFPTIKNVDGFGFNLEARIHPSKKALRGFYIAPNFSHNSFENGNQDATSIGILLGWQWFPGDDFAIGLGLGIDRYVGSYKENFFYQGTFPIVRFDIGYAW